MVNAAPIRVTAPSPAGVSRTFRVSRPRSAVALLRHVADVDRNGVIGRYDARRSAVAATLLAAADTAGGRGRLSKRELVRYATHQAGSDRRYSKRELDRMLARLGVRSNGPGTPPAIGPANPGLLPGTGKLPQQPPTSPPTTGPLGSEAPGPPAPGTSPSPSPSPSPTPPPGTQFQTYTVEEAYHGIFNVFDKDESGLVDAADASGGQPLLGLMGVASADEAQVAAFVSAHYDTNHNGMVDCKEHELIYAELFGVAPGYLNC